MLAAVRRHAHLLIALAAAAYSLVVVVSVVTEVRREINDPGDTDYIGIVSAGYILDSGSSCLYCYDTQQVAQDTLLHIPTNLPAPSHFVNTPLAAPLTIPFARLSLRSGVALFDLTSLLLLGTAGILLLRLMPPMWAAGQRILLLALTVGMLPAMAAIAQWSSLMLVASLLAVVAMNRGRWIAAGLLLSLLLIKPQVVWLVVPLLVAARSWRVLLGFALGALVNALVGLLVIGPQQTLELLHLIADRSIPQAGAKVGVPALAVAVTGRDSAGIATAGLLAALTCVAAWRYRDRLRHQPLIAVGLGIAASIAFSPYVGIPDLGLVTVAAGLWARVRYGEAVAALLLVNATFAFDFVLTFNHNHTLPIAMALFLAGAGRRLLLTGSQELPPGAGDMTCIPKRVPVRAGWHH